MAAGREEKLAELETKIAEREAQLIEHEKKIKRLNRFKENLGKQIDQLAEMLAASESVVHGIPDPLIIVNLEGVVTYVNEACCELSGWSRNEVVGKLKETDVWQHDGDSQRSLLEQCLRTKEAIVNLSRTYGDRQGNPAPLAISAGPQLSSLGELRGAFAIYRDVSREVKLTDELLEAGSRVIEVHTSAAEILTSAQEQATTATEQATTVSEVTTTATELAGSAKSVAESCSDIASATTQLLASAQTGQEVLAQVLADMKKLREMTREAGDKIFDLGEKSKQIDTVVDLIGKVAAETKLIAFNAAIEAARAGDAGRGFAVVATEVKGLAESVAESSTEIKTLVGDIQSSTNRSILTAEGQVKLMVSVSELSNRSNVAFGEIVDGIGRVNDRARMISASSGQQRSATEQLTGSMSEVNRAANQSAEAAKQTMNAVSQLAEFASQLNAALQKFNDER